MAGPVGHLVCALAFINSNLSEISHKNSFFAGNVFPDIRYIAPIKRSVTHIKKISLKSIIKEQNDFTKGHFLHIWLDKEREAFMQEHKVYDFIEYKKYRSQIIKLAEDYILFNQIKNYNLDTAFNLTYKKELDYNLDYKNIFLWHEIIKNYISSSKIFDNMRYIKSAWFIINNLDLPKKDENKNIFYKAKKYTQIIILGVYASYKLYQLSNDKKFTEIVNNFYSNHINKKFNYYYY